MQSSINLPLFPQFKLLEFQDKSRIETFTKQFLPYSDFNFVSLLTYNNGNDLSFSWLNGNLTVRFCDYLTKKPFYSFLGCSRVIDTINILLDYSKKERLAEELRLIPEANINDFFQSNSHNLSVQEDEDHNDYIISLEKTIDLSNINPHKQEAYRMFLREYPDYRIEQLNITNLKIQSEILKLFHAWKEQKKKKSDVEDIELLPLRRLLEFSLKLTLFALGLYIGNELIGFIIDERVQKPYVVGHFIKANLSYSGVYEVLNKVSAEMHYQNGYEFINIEQDLGIRGLRISKKQRNPVSYLKKYIIARK